MARAEKSGRKLSCRDAELVKGMIERGDRHHDIAAWFGVNQGRIAEINNGEAFKDALTAKADTLPPQGPYMSGRSANTAFNALEDAKKALENALKTIDSNLTDIRSS